MFGEPTVSVSGSLAGYTEPLSQNVPRRSRTTRLPSVAPDFTFDYPGHLDIAGYPAQVVQLVSAHSHDDLVPLAALIHSVDQVD